MKYIINFLFGIIILSSAGAQGSNQILKNLSSQERWAYVKEAFPPGNSFGINPIKLKSICMLIDSRTKDPNPTGNYIYMYQRKIMDAAGVDVNKDSPDIISKKIIRMWSFFEPLPTCDNLQFDVSDGNIIKYAISTLFDEFLYDMVTWKVPLNKIDDSDNKTALDYLSAQIKRNKGNALEPKLQNYFKLLREAGAKYSSEL